jgi:hypothetical protein
VSRRRICGGEFVDREIEVRITTESRPVVLPAMAQSVCPQCERRAYTVATLERIEAFTRLGRTRRRLVC